MWIWKGRLCSPAQMRWSRVMGPRCALFRQHVHERPRVRVRVWAAVGGRVRARARARVRVGVRVRARARGKLGLEPGLGSS